MTAAKDALYSNPNQRPPRPVFIGKNIPECLRELPQWIGWGFKWKDEDKRWSKIPLNPHIECRKSAKANDPNTWTTYAAALRATNDAIKRATSSADATPSPDGVGFVFNGQGVFGLDIDGCRNPETGELSPLATKIVADFATYTEVSPSGMGIKLFGFGVLPMEKGRKVKLADGQDLELYDRGRYFTVTGQLLPGGPTDVAECDGALSALVAAYFPAEQAGTSKKSKTKTKPSSAKPAGQLDDLTIIQFIRRKHDALWSGSVADHGGDDSAADLALVNLIAFFAGPDAARIDSIFRQSGLMREKWKRSDYSGSTIAKALEGRTEFYSPEYGSRPARLADSDANTPVSGTGAEIILAFFRRNYHPVFRRKNFAVCRDGAEISRVDVCAVATFAVIAQLANATDAPKFPNGAVRHDSLPGFFKKWAPVAWGEMIDKLPFEDETDPGIMGEVVRDEFRRMVRDAMLSEVVLGETVGDTASVTRTERRSLIDWCWKFAKTGPWRSIRSKKCWCRCRKGPATGELFLDVAIRQELFAQLRANPKLCEMGANTFARRAARYGVGTSSQKERPEGRAAVVLSQEFVNELLEDVHDDAPLAGEGEGDDTGDLDIKEETVLEATVGDQPTSPPTVESDPERPQEPTPKPTPEPPNSEGAIPSEWEAF